jgi:ABC-type nitrate/sulfonate/bicarbonate transport system ATPase subunit
MLVVQYGERLVLLSPTGIGKSTLPRYWWRRFTRSAARYCSMEWQSRTCQRTAEPN